MKQTMWLLKAKRCTIFLHDDHSGHLWSLAGTGITHKNQIRIDPTVGAAGWVFRHRQPLRIEDAYQDPRFYRGIDRRTGFTTRNILCMPLINPADACIGAIQALNKLSGPFTDEDELLLSATSRYVAISLENARLYEEMIAVDQAKKKIIDHLAHEVRTPVAIIDAGLAHISRKLGSGSIDGLGRTIERCQRNLKRLLNLQEKVTDIHNQRLTEDRERIVGLIQDAISLAEEASEDRTGAASGVLERMHQRLEAIYRTETFRPEEIRLDGFLSALCDKATRAMGNREVAIARKLESGLVLRTDRAMLEKICGGLLKNAIEATPDEGKVHIAASSSDNGIAIDFRDWGVGITTKNQKNIFNGFFHTQDTAYYMSRKPYAFYAGGSGSDLLRIKVFSERYGFQVRFVSKCCRHIPGMKNLCPGRVSKCRFVDGEPGCMASGGSRFRLLFPEARPSSTHV